MQNLLLCTLIATSSAMMARPAMTMESISFLAEAPSGVANVMSKVEQRWLDLALQAAALDCESTRNANNCTTKATKGYAFGNFTDSCHTVSKAIVATTAGDRSRVQSYMSNVCGQDILKGKREELCLDFSQYLVKEMSEYQHDNLEGSMDLKSVCTDFFNNGYIGRYAEQERKAWAEMQAEKEAEEQRKADLAADAQAKADVDTKAALARQRLEAMQNATAAADAKREEAVQAAVTAQRKAEESEAAVEMQKRLKAEADAAETQAQAAKAKATELDTRLGSRNASATNHSITSKSFLAVAPFTFS